MNDNFKVIYRILSHLEKELDAEKTDLSQIDYEQFGISETRWKKYLAMLLDAGYITGIKVFENIDGEIRIQNDRIMITIKGLEYLSENTIMRRIYKEVKGIKEII